ncbi:MAG: hypothetical protein AB7E51_15145 [Pseudodesulfovibrio sp.]|uniref:hypothetical protein n=1 Tax=Pseudodesulfovibrio sp. TaxID=2035812 RepID=UPI003D0AE1C1
MSETALIATAIGTSIVGTGVSAYSSYAQGQAAKDAAEEQAKIAEQNAKDAEYTGSLERQRINLKKAETIGTGRAAWGSSGVALGSGSPVDWEVDVDERGRSDVRASKYNSNVTAYNYRTGANLARYGGANASAAGMTGSFGSLLSGAGTVAGDWYKYKYAA